MVLRRIRPGERIVELERVTGLMPTVLSEGPPGLVVLDLNLPDTEGCSGVTYVRHRFPEVPLAVYSASPASDFEKLCLEAGADLYIEKDAGATELSAALKGLLMADPPADTEDVVDEPEANNKLSKRQKQLIVLLEQGQSNRAIAERLAISEHTVKVHLWRLFRKLGVNSRTQALHFARINGLIQG